MAYFEWSALPPPKGVPLEDVLDDPARLLQANPSKPRGRITDDFSGPGGVERNRLTTEGYAIERFGIFHEDDEEAAAWQLYSEERWLARYKPQVKGETWQLDPVALAVEVHPERGWTAIGSGGKHPAGGIALELVEYREGTDWAVARLIELAKHNPKGVVIDPNAGAGAFVKPLRAAGITVVEYTGAEYQRACGGMSDDVMAPESNVHHHNQAPLTRAASVAVKRLTRDGFVVDRRTEHVTPMCCLILARHGAIEIPDPVKRGGMVVA